MFLLVVCILLASCKRDPAPSPKALPTEDTALIPAIGRELFFLHRDSFDLSVRVGDLVIEEGQILFQRSLMVSVRHADGHDLLLLRAQKGHSPSPFAFVEIEDFLIQCEDGTEIEGEKLKWQRGAELPIQVEGGLNLVNDKGRLTGKGLRGDILMRGYIIDEVESVVLWDALAGGRAGYRKGN